MVSLKQRWRAARPKLVSGIVYGLLRAVNATLRMTVSGEPEDLSNSIICGWHGKSFMFANQFRGHGYWVIISHSNDGEMQTRIFSRLGFQVIRGSTGRGGVRAAVEAIRALRNGGTMAVTPDGPRGPSGVVQGGVMLMAQKSGARLIPCGLYAKPCIRAKSWDRYMLPIPFGRGMILMGEPVLVPADATEAQVEEIRQQFQAAIHSLEVEAERRLDRKI
jgi:lysophospholipid acyltransferase (LPLAT)-like uncharacterized protein